MSSALAIGSLLVGQVALAAPFSYRYTDTISDGTLPTGLAIGDAVEITFTLDNGGTSCNSQTWTATDLQSVTFNFNNNTLNTTFTAPFGSGLDSSSDGNFVSDASGNLTDVMSDWGDGAVGTDFTTNGDDPDYWYVNGGNPVYNTTSSEDVSLTNFGNMTAASNWSLSGTCTAGSPIAVPSGLHFSKQIEIFATEINEK